MSALLAIVLLLEVVGLRSGTTGIVLIGLIAAIAAGVIAFQVDLRIAGVAAACAACFTLTWNGWFVGPLRPGDILILVALLAFAAANPNGAFRTPPWWVKQLIFVLVLGVLAQVYFAPSAMYLSNRIVLNATGVTTDPAIVGSLAITNILVAGKFVIAVAATPVVFVGAVRVDRRAVRWLPIAFATGAALSGWVAGLDHLGGDFGRILTGLPNIGNRQVGLSNHPNFLAAGLVLAIPFAYWLLLAGRRADFLLGLAALPGILAGIYASGSRGGAVCTLAVLALCVVIHPRSRRYTLNFAGVGLFVVGLTAVALPAFGAAILAATRLSGGVATEGSDTVRSLVYDQGVRDFERSPLIGIGLQASTDSSLVYLQELASGGLLLFIGVNIYMLGGIAASYRIMHESTLAGMVLAALLGTLLLNIFEADLTDRFYYVPAAILIALIEAGRLGNARPAQNRLDAGKTHGASETGHSVKGTA